MTFKLAIATGVSFLVGFRLHGSLLEGLAAFGFCVLLDNPAVANEKAAPRH